MIYVEPSQLPAPLLLELARQGHKEQADLAMGLLTKAYQVYVVGSIVVLVETREGVLYLDAVLQTGKPGAHMRSLLAGLKKLAKFWGLKEVQTTSDNASVIRLLKLFGSKVMSVNLKLEI